MAEQVGPSITLGSATNRQTNWVMTATIDASTSVLKKKDSTLWVATWRRTLRSVTVPRGWLTPLPDVVLVFATLHGGYAGGA